MKLLQTVCATVKMLFHTLALLLNKLETGLEWTGSIRRILWDLSGSSCLLQRRGGLRGHANGLSSNVVSLMHCIGKFTAYDLL
jgi:hypothetical protein